MEDNIIIFNEKKVWGNLGFLLTKPIPRTIIKGKIEISLRCIHIQKVFHSSFGYNGPAGLLSMRLVGWRWGWMPSDDCGTLDLEGTSEMPSWGFHSFDSWKTFCCKYCAFSVLINNQLDWAELSSRDVWKRLCISCIKSWGQARENNILNIFRVFANNFLRRPTHEGDSFPTTYSDCSQTRITGIFSSLTEPSPDGRNGYVSINACFLFLLGSRLDYFF